MNAASALRHIKDIQKAFQVIAALHLTAYLWPQQAIVQNGATFDFIVVGAGSAGSIIASRLAEDKNTSVLLIEAGGDPPIECNLASLMIYLENTNLDWGYTTEDDGYTLQCNKNNTIALFMGKMLGGTSGLNYLLYSQGHYRDYDNWATLTDDPSWSWKNVLPYFTKAQRLDVPPIFRSISNDFLGSSGPIGVTRDLRSDNYTYLSSFKEIGNKLVLDINGQDTVGYSQSFYTIADGIRQSSAYSHLRAVKDNANLKVLKNTLVKKILFDENNNAIGVEAVLETGEIIIVKANKEVIVSAGAINSPKLLMLSGIGPKEHLESKGINVISDLPVGENLQDHTATIIIHNMTKLDEPIKPLDPAEYPAVVFTGYANLDKTKDDPEYSTVSFVNYAKYLIEFCTLTYGLQDEICDAFFANLNTNQMLFTLVTSLRPKSRGRILLRSTDFEDAPIVKTGYFSEKEDLKNQVKYIEDFVRITETSFFRNSGGVWVNPNLSCCENEEIGTTAYWKCYALCVMTTRRHYAGTCAMGAVVDSKLKVKGVQRLRVVDASIMPVITSGDTNMPTVMIAERAADFIKIDYKYKICA